MRLQQLALRVSGDGQKLRFHERLTVISGISVEDRQGVVEVMLGTLAGEPTVSSELAYVGRSGQRITVDQTAEGTFHTFHDDGTPAPPPSLHLGLSVHELFELMYVDGRQLGILQQGPSEPKELLEARTALAALADQLETAEVARDAAESFRLELLAIDEEIRQIEIGRPRRRYARMLLELEALKRERRRAVVDVGRSRCRPGDGLAPRPAPPDRGPVAGGGPQAVGRVPGVRPRPGAARPPRARRRAHPARRRAAATRLAGRGAGDGRGPARHAVGQAGRADGLAPREPVAPRRRPPGPSRSEGAVAGRPARHRHRRQARGRVDRPGRLVADRRLAQAGDVEEIESARAAVEQAEEVIEKRRIGVVAARGAAALGAVALPLAPLVAPLALAGTRPRPTGQCWPRASSSPTQCWGPTRWFGPGVPSLPNVPSPPDGGAQGRDAPGCRWSRRPSCTARRWPSGVRWRVTCPPSRRWRAKAGPRLRRRGWSQCRRPRRRRHRLPSAG